MRALIRAVTAGAVALAGAVAYATIPDSRGVVHGCYDTNGALRVIDTGAGQSCASRETPLNWSQTGPAGPVGPAGVRGNVGPQGAPGPAGTALAYAHVQANGTIDQGSGNVTVSKIYAGGYCIGVTGGTVHAAVVSLDSRANVGGTVQAGVFNASGCPANANNILVVARPHAQDGGSPGADRAFYIIVN